MRRTTASRGRAGSRRAAGEQRAFLHDLLHPETPPSQPARRRMGLVLPWAELASFPTEPLVARRAEAHCPRDVTLEVACFVRCLRAGCHSRSRLLRALSDPRLHAVVDRRREGGRGATARTATVFTASTADSDRP